MHLRRATHHHIFTLECRRHCIKKKQPPWLFVFLTSVNNPSFKLAGKSFILGQKLSNSTKVAEKKKS